VPFAVRIPLGPPGRGILGRLLTHITVPLRSCGRLEGERVLAVLDIVFVAVIVALIALVALVAKGVERL
jgi:hypothetical protein